MLLQEETEITIFILDSSITCELFCFDISLGFNVKASTSADGYYEVNKNAVNVPGFVSLNQLLSKHVGVPEIYHLVISLLLKHPVQGIEKSKMF